jgi:hypothetical protein
MRTVESGQFGVVRASGQSSWPALYNPRRMRALQELEA